MSWWWFGDKFTFTCFLRSCGRLKALPQKSHLWGFRGTWTRIWDVIWSRLTVVVLQEFHLQVRFKLFVLLRPTWRSQRWSLKVSVNWYTEDVCSLTYVECFSWSTSLSTLIPLTDKIIFRCDRCIVLSWWFSGCRSSTTTTIGLLLRLFWTRHFRFHYLVYSRRRINYFRKNCWFDVFFWCVNIFFAKRFDDFCSPSWLMMVNNNTRTGWNKTNKVQEREKKIKIKRDSGKLRNEARRERKRTRSYSILIHRTFPKVKLPSGGRYAKLLAFLANFMTIFTQPPLLLSILLPFSFW